jgi:hypothetical protein
MNQYAENNPDFLTMLKRTHVRIHQNKMLDFHQATHPALNINHFTQNFRWKVK